MADFRTAFNYLQTWGFADAILPFLLFFSIIFAVLQKVKIFKEGEEDKADRKMNGIIAFVIAMMVIVPHIIGQYPAGMNPVNLINKILPTSAVIIFAIVIIFIFIGLLGNESTQPGVTPIARLLGLLGVIVVLYVFISNMFPNIGLAFGPLKDPGIQALLVVFGVFGAIVWFIMKKDDKPKKTWTERLNSLFE